MTHTAKAKFSKMSAKAKKMLLLRIYMYAIASGNRKLLSMLKVKSSHKMKHKRRHRKSKKHSKRRHSRRHGKKHKSGRKLSAGIHHVNIGGKMRKVKVLANGRWRFMKG